MECRHERQQKTEGFVFCADCGEEIYRFFELFVAFQKLNKNLKFTGSRQTTRKALQIYKVSGKNTVRKNIIYGCFCLAWPGNETAIRQQIGLNVSLAQTVQRRNDKLGAETIVVL